MLFFSFFCQKLSNQSRVSIHSAQFQYFHAHFHNSEHNSTVLIFAIRVVTDYFKEYSGRDVYVCYRTTLLHFHTLSSLVGIHSLLQTLLCYKGIATPSWAASKRFFRKPFRGSENELSREQSEMAGSVWYYLHLLFWDPTCDSDTRPGGYQINHGEEF